MKVGKAKPTTASNAKPRTTAENLKTPRAKASTKGAFDFVSDDFVDEYSSADLIVSPALTQTSGQKRRANEEAELLAEIEHQKRLKVLISKRDKLVADNNEADDEDEEDVEEAEDPRDRIVASKKKRKASSPASLSPDDYKKRRRHRRKRPRKNGKSRLLMENVDRVLNSQKMDTLVFAQLSERQQMERQAMFQLFERQESKR